MREVSGSSMNARAVRFYENDSDAREPEGPGAAIPAA
jgi:hypothetical protein